MTGPGRVGIDPETGLRRRRHGVSSVPTSSILHGASAVPTLHSHSDYRRSGEDPGDSNFPEGMAVLILSDHQNKYGQWAYSIHKGTFYIFINNVVKYRSYSTLKSFTF